MQRYTAQIGWFLGGVIAAMACVGPAIADEAAAASPAAPADATTATPDVEEMLTIGSAAPALDIEHWVQNGEGRFQPVTAFEPGKVYVVEFWATWCGPCIGSMPHLNETQTKYADRGVTIISVSDEELETVTKFLERPSRVKRPAAETVAAKDESEEAADAESELPATLTYDEITKVYCLTTDPDGSVYSDYMKAARQDGIPTAFIVGKSGQLEWVGHPMSMDEPLEGVVADTWDRDEFAVSFREKQELNKLMYEVQDLAEAGKGDVAKQKLEAFGKSAVDEESIEMVEYLMQQVDVMAFEGMLDNDQSAASAALPALLEQVGDDMQGVYGLVNSVVDFVEEDGGAVGSEILDPLKSAVQKMIDNEAHPIFYQLKAQLLSAGGDLDGAIKVAEEAVEKVDAKMKGYFGKFLADLKKEKAGPEASNEADAEGEGSEAGDE